MGIQLNGKRCLEMLLVCLYMLSSGSTFTVDDSLSKREVIINGPRNPIRPSDYVQQDFHPTHEKVVPEGSLLGLPSPQRQKLPSGRKRRSAAGSSASLDRRRELYNEFLRKTLRKRPSGRGKKDKTVSEPEDKSETGANASRNTTSLTSSLSPSTPRPTESLNRSFGTGNQATKKDLPLEKASPTPETRSTFTLSPDQREERRQLLIKRNKEERLQRLRELHHRRNSARQRKLLLKKKRERERNNRLSFPQPPSTGNRLPRLQNTEHEKDGGIGIVTSPTIKPKKNRVEGTPEFQESRSNRLKGRNKSRGDASVSRSKKTSNNALVLEPREVNPFISAPRANDYLTSLDSVAERKKYTRRVVLREKVTSPTPIAVSSRSGSKRSAIELEQRLIKRTKGLKVKPTSGWRENSRGRSRQISKNDRKRIRRIRQNRLKMKERKRRKNRKRKRRNRKNRSRHKKSSPDPVSTPFIVTSTPEYRSRIISSSQPNDFSSTNKRNVIQTENNPEASTTSFIPTTTQYDQKTTFTTSRASSERPTESEKVSNAPNQSSATNSSDDEADIEDTQLISELDLPSNSSSSARDQNTTVVADEEINESTDKRNGTIASAPHPADALNLSTEETSASSFPENASTANVSLADGASGAVNLTQMSNASSVVGDVENSQELSNGSASQVNITSIGSMPDDDDEWPPLRDTNSSDLNETTTTNTTEIQTGTTLRIGTDEQLLLLSPSTTSTAIVTSSMDNSSHGAALNVTGETTGEMNISADASEVATTQVPLISSPSSSASLHHNENNSSTTSENEKRLSSSTSNKETSTSPYESDNEDDYYNTTYTPISSSTGLPTEIIISSPTISSTPLLSSSLSQSKTTLSPHASRWIAWAKRRRKKSKDKSKSGTENKQPSQKSRGVAEGSVALALAEAEKEDSSQLASSRRPVTEPTTTKGPFIGYKTAYDFLSNQKGLKVSVLNENRREARDINKFMGENMCEIFNKHYVPTRIGGKCV